MRVSLVIELYEKNGRKLVNILELEASDPEFFKETLSVPGDDPLVYGAYRIDTTSNEKIFERYGFMLDVKRYDCYAGYRRIA